MKKKIKLGELTLRKYKELCYEHSRKKNGCAECPLSELNIRCYEEDFVDDEELDCEVEIDD